jgi:hypothetical protein
MRSGGYDPTASRRQSGSGQALYLRKSHAGNRATFRV